jgi:transmembrane sensor
MATPPRPPPRPPVDLPISDDATTPLMREALSWIAYLNSGEERAEDWEAFETWKAASEQHRHAAAEAEALWEQLGPSLARYKKSRNRTIPVIVVAAIGLSAAAFAGGLFGPPAAYFAEYQSSTGEVRHVVLRDGSRVALDTATSFDVSDDHRTLTLYAGQVFVDVQHDLERPFRVLAGEGSVEALGTAFAVRRDGEAASVVVTDNAVRVRRQQRDQVDSVDVSAGQAVSYSQAGLGAPRDTDAATLTAWRLGEIHFHGRPLGEVAAEIERYRRGKIVILDAALKALPVTGSFDLHDTDTILKAMELSLPIRVVRMPGLAMIMRDSGRMLPGR